MMLTRFALVLPFALTVLASPYVFQNTLDDDSKCAKKGHIIGVRGTTEKPGFGALQTIVDSLQRRVKDVTAEAVDYPADGIDIIDGKIVPRFLEYVVSERAGLTSLAKVLADYTENCQNTPVILMGYSQGAQVVGDAICGTSSDYFIPSPPVDSFFTENLRAIIQLGDPTNVAGLSWHLGNSTRGGLFPRKNYYACSAFSNRWMSWCDAEDLFCDGQGGIDMHLGYVTRYGDQIVDFIADQLQDDTETIEL